jgi:hypothetical protein
MASRSICNPSSHFFDGSAILKSLHFWLWGTNGITWNAIFPTSQALSPWNEIRRFDDLDPFNVVQFKLPNMTTWPPFHSENSFVLITIVILACSSQAMAGLGPVRIDPLDASPFNTWLQTNRRISGGKFDNKTVDFLFYHSIWPQPSLINCAYESVSIVHPILTWFKLTSIRAASTRQVVPGVRVRNATNCLTGSLAPLNWSTYAVEGVKRRLRPHLLRPSVWLAALIEYGLSLSPLLFLS